MTTENISLSVSTEFWFIPTDILMVSCSSIAVLLSLFSLFIIIVDKACHTIPMMLTTNTCVAVFIFSSDMLALAIFTLHNDLKQIRYQDSLCVFRGILVYITVLQQNYSFLCQAIYRYIKVVHSNRLFYQSAKFQGIIIGISWTFGFVVYGIPLIVVGNIQYLVDDQICQQPMTLSFVMIYNVLLIFLIPSLMTISIYYKLIVYVKTMNKRSMAVNQVNRAKQELTMLRRIVILNAGFMCICIPKASMIFIGYFTSPPKYHYRVSYIFVHISLIFVMGAIFKFTDQFQNFIMKRIRPQQNLIAPTLTHSIRTVVVQGPSVS